jgi:hypothetical protein
MNITFAVVFLLAVMTFCGLAGKSDRTGDSPASNQPAKPAFDRDAVKKELAKLSEKIMTAAQHGDVSYLAKITTEDFESTDADGRVQTKNKALADVKEEKNIRSLDVSEAELQSADENGAVLQYVLRVTGKNGRLVKARITDSYVKQDSEWMLKRQQQTIMK